LFYLIRTSSNTVKSILGSAGTDYIPKTIVSFLLF